MQGTEKEVVTPALSATDRGYIARTARRLLIKEVSKLSPNHARILITHQDYVDNLIDQIEGVIRMAVRSAEGDPARALVTTPLMEVTRALLAELRESCGS
jgi:hypothetical protein